MEIQKNLNKRALWLLMLMLVFSSSTIMISIAGNEQITVKGTSHYVFFLGILDKEYIVEWNITVTNGVSISLYIANASQYERYADDPLSWSPEYENRSRTIHDHQYKIPHQANWTLVLENPNQADALVTYDFPPKQIGGFTIITGLLGLTMAMFVIKRRKN